jgi:hypothetical protein
MIPEDRGMTRITDFECVGEKGEPVLSDAYGNNVAFKCPDCGHPMLAIVLSKQSRSGSTQTIPRGAVIVSTVGG